MPGRARHARHHQVPCGGPPGGRGRYDGLGPLSTAPDQCGRMTRDDRIRLDVPDYDAGRGHHAFSSDVRHDYAAVADPGILANRNSLETATLFPDGHVAVAKRVLTGAADDVHVAPHEDIVGDDAIADRAIAPDVDPMTDLDC